MASDGFYCDCEVCREIRAAERVPARAVGPVRRAMEASYVRGFEHTSGLRLPEWTGKLVGEHAVSSLLVGIKIGFTAGVVIAAILAMAVRLWVLS